MEDVLAVVAGWDPRCAAVLAKAPSCVDWKLVYREPCVPIDGQVEIAFVHSQLDRLPTWISKGSRMAVIGDAAHPFLP